MPGRSPSGSPGSAATSPSTTSVPGSGASTTSSTCPFDFLKIDGEFVKALADNPIDKLVIEAVVRIAQGLGKRTIAEFVEDETTLEILRRSGVDLVQGFGIGRPAPALEVLGLGRGPADAPRSRSADP